MDNYEKIDLVYRVCEAVGKAYTHDFADSFLSAIEEGRSVDSTPLDELDALLDKAKAAIAAARAALVQS